MKIITEELIEDITISDIVIFSGIRPLGRSIDWRKLGRPNHGLFYIFKGGASFSQESGKSLDLKQGELLYIPQGSKYKMHYNEENTSFITVNFDMFFNNKEPIALANNITIIAKDNNARIYENIMAKFEVFSASQSLATSFRKKEYLYRLFSMIYNDQSTLLIEQQRFPQILKGVILLKQTYLENLPISSFAKESNISISSFRDLFSKQYGTSPLQYRNNLRINKAKEMLKEGDCTVAEAAFASGFENIGYFCRYYKRITGETPSQTKNKIN